MMLDHDALRLIAAPLVNQSDLPFRILTRRYGATLAYTQMLHPDRLTNDQEYTEYHLRQLGEAHDRPVVVQLCGNDPETVVRGAKVVADRCDGIDLNLGCPLEDAMDNHYGAYLLGKKDWPLVEQIVSSLSHTVPLPISTKLRLCNPQDLTPVLAQRLEHAGSAHITLHARHASTRRRRAGAAQLEWVRAVKDAVRVPVISNGNVRTWEDIERNLDETGADGVMVGETLLGNPCLFAKIVPDPVAISLEYLEICREHDGTAALSTVQTHVRRFVEFQCARRPWYGKFRVTLGECKDLDEIEHLLRFKVQRWRDQPVLAD